MAESGDDVFANREGPVPFLTVTNSDDGSSTSEVEVDGKRRKVRKALSASNLKDKMQRVGQAHEEKMEKMETGTPSLHDRLFAK